MTWLINASQLEKLRKDQKNVVILDATWPRDPLAERIIGARFFDLDLFYDQTNALPCMLTRDEALIAKQMSTLGISNDNKIIVYDNNTPTHSACRALWMLKVFGHTPHHLYLLDGGLAAWKKFGGKLETAEARPIVPREYVVNYQAQLIRTLLQMKSNLHHPQEQVVDVRHPVRFAGGPESRADLRRGHIPHSFSFYYMTMFEKDSDNFCPLDKIRRQLAGIGIDLDAPIITSCGSGNTAAMLDIALDLIGHTQHALYDGSWTEWGANTLYAGETSIDERPVVRSVDE